MSFVRFARRAAIALAIRYVAARRTNKRKIVIALFVASVALATLPAATPSYAENVAYMSGAGSDNNPCTAAQPCQTIDTALGAANAPNRVFCLDPPNTGGNLLFAEAVPIEIDCIGVWSASIAAPAMIVEATSVLIKIRNMTFSGRSGATNAMKLSEGGGTVIFENCVFEDFSSVALDLEPIGPLNLVIRNSRISNNGGGVLLKPAAGGSIKATLDHVVITANTGGGIKADSTNGTIDLNVTDSEISNNSGNGINAVGNASLNVVNIKNSVIAKNGTAGVQANGASVGVLVSTTLLDQNVAGATSIVTGGHVYTYGNNNIVGSIGSGFTGAAPLQ